MSQWKIYLTFCEDFKLVPLPASMDTILLYLAFLADTRSYVTIINYLSAVWSLHKLNNLPHLDPSSFPIQMTLSGIRRTLGDCAHQATALSVKDLRLMFTRLDLQESEDVAFWLAIIFCFRGLLRKSNVVEQGLAVLLSDVSLEPWGLVLHIRRTKTITCRERVLEVPFNRLPNSIFCACRFLSLLISMVPFPSPMSQLISYTRRGKWVRGTYTWFNTKLAGICAGINLSGVSTHSLRRGGATALYQAGFSLLEIRDIGDWSSLAVLQYLAKSLNKRRELDEKMCDALFDD